MNTPSALLLLTGMWIVLSGHTISSQQKDVKLSIFPYFSKDQLNQYYIAVGTTVSFTCALTSSDYDVENDILIMSNSVTTVVNTSRISFSRKLTEVSNPMYSCCVNQCPPIFETEENPTHEVATLYIGYPPASVDGFACVSISLTNLICSWTINPSNSTNVNWTMEYEIFDSTGNVDKTYCKNAPCSCVPQVNGTRYTCTVGPGHFQEMRNYTISVVGYNSYGTTRYTTSVYTDPAIATYPRLKDMTVSLTGSTWLNVTWQPADTSLLPSTPTYRITVAGGTTPSSQTLFTNATSYNITGLKPYTCYTLSVQSRPYCVDYYIYTTSIWSRSLSSIVRTGEDRPSSPPLLTSGGFTWWSPDSQPHLTVYWKAVPAEKRNGNVTDYKICLHDVTDSMYVYNTSECVLAQSYYYTWSITCPHCPYQVSVQAGTHAGFSKPDTLFIPSMDVTEPHRVEYVIAEKICLSLYNISWVTSEHDVDNVTVTWSLRKNPDITVYFDFKVFPSNRLYALVSPAFKPQSESDVELRFGVALSSTKWTSGVTWSQCIFGQRKVTQAPLVDITTTEHDLVVSLRFSYCVPMTSRPFAYSVMYRRQTGSGVCNKNETRDGQKKIIPALYNTSSIIIDTLEEYVDYCVSFCILYKNYTGPTSDPVKVRLKQPTPYNTASGTKVKIVAGTLSAVLITAFIITGLVLFVRSTRKKIRIDTFLMERMEEESHHPISDEDESAGIPVTMPSHTTEDETAPKIPVGMPEDATGNQTTLEVSFSMTNNKTIKQTSASNAAVAVDEKVDSTATSDEKPDSMANSDEKPNSMVTSDEKPDSMANSDEKPDYIPNSDEKPDSIPNSDEKPDSIPNSDKKVDFMANSDEKPDSIPNSDEKSDSMAYSDEKVDSTADSSVLNPSLLADHEQTHVKELQFNNDGSVDRQVNTETCTDPEFNQCTTNFESVDKTDDKITQIQSHTSNDVIPNLLILTTSRSDEPADKDTIPDPSTAKEYIPLSRIMQQAELQSLSPDSPNTNPTCSSYVKADVIYSSEERDSEMG